MSLYGFVPWVWKAWYHRRVCVWHEKLEGFAQSVVQNELVHMAQLQHEVLQF